MSDERKGSPPNVWRMNSFRLRLKRSHCSGCGKAHVLDRPVCLKIREEENPIVINNNQGIIFAATTIEESIPS